MALPCCPAALPLQRMESETLFQGPVLLGGTKGTTQTADECAKKCSETDKCTFFAWCSSEDG